MNITPGMIYFFITMYDIASFAKLTSVIIIIITAIVTTLNLFAMIDMEEDEKEINRVAKRAIKIIAGCILIILTTLLVPSERDLIRMYTVPKVVKYIEVIEKYIDKGLSL